MHEIDHESATATPSHELNADGRMRAALKDALPYMQCFYELLTNSHNTHASTLAANTQAVAENTRVLNSLTSCVDVVKQSQQTLNNGHDADGRMRTALKDVPLYMQWFLELLSKSHNTHASAIAANTQAVAENTSALNSLMSRVDAVEKGQQALSNRHNADLPAVRAEIARHPQKDPRIKGPGLLVYLQSRDERKSLN